MKNEIKKNQYWEERGKGYCFYKGEDFYTITPIPYYFKRREILLKLLIKFFRNDSKKKVCDFGCGDGWYLSYFEKFFPQNKYYGVDISETMIQRAKGRCKEVNLEISNKGINFQEKFDLVYSIAVFAHVKNDQTVKWLFENIYEKLDVGGKFIFFEQTGSFRTQGDTWTRRTQEEYCEMAKKSGFSLESKTHLRFSAHVFFERTVAKIYYRYFAVGKNNFEKGLFANNSYIFRVLSSLFLKLSFKPIKSDKNSKFGNTLFVFTRR